MDRSLQNAAAGNISLRPGDWLVLGLTAVSIFFLKDYFDVFSLPGILGLMAMFFGISKGQGGPFSFRYAIAAVVFLALSFLVPVKTLLYFAIGFSYFFLAETKGIRIRFLSCAILVIMCPAFYYAANAFSFPVRVQLSALVGQLFHFLSIKTEIRGNMIYHENGEFSVDPACMGLNMLVASLLLGAMLTGYYESLLQKRASWKAVLVFLAGIVGLNIISNLIRILMIVQFTILPGTTMHDITGLTCLFVYVVLPANWLAKRVVSQSATIDKKVAANRSRGAMRIAVLLISVVVVCGVRVKHTDSFAAFAQPAKTAGGYNVSVFAPGILKLENKGHLVYIKYIRGFYDTDHNPTLCWVGSGYSFTKVQRMQLGGHEYYTAMLVNGKEVLYTSWWYGNGKKNTCNQMDWRRDMLFGARNYAVINVTAASSSQLQKEVERIIIQRSLDPLFHIQ
jgi:exosortase N